MCTEVIVAAELALRGNSFRPMPPDRWWRSPSATRGKVCGRAATCWKTPSEPRLWWTFWRQLRRRRRRSEFWRRSCRCVIAWLSHLGARWFHCNAVYIITSNIYRVCIIVHIVKTYLAMSILYTPHGFILYINYITTCSLFGPSLFTDVLRPVSLNCSMTSLVHLLACFGVPHVEAPAQHLLHGPGRGDARRRLPFGEIRADAVHGRESLHKRLRKHGQSFRV